VPPLEFTLVYVTVAAVGAKVRVVMALDWYTVPDDVVTVREPLARE
jgi:hypothetical protein